MEKQVTHIVCTPDDNYAMHCGAMLASLFRNNSGTIFRIHICHHELSKANRKRLQRVVSAHGGQCRFYHVTRLIESLSLPLHYHFTVSAYIRLFLTEILDPDIQRVIYLDADLIIRRPIGPLMALDLGSHPIAATEEPVMAKHGGKLGLVGTYFNAGVLVIPLHAWRNMDVSTMVRSFIATDGHRIEFADQDVLNVLFDQQWLHLAPIWNVTHYFYSNAIFPNDLHLEKAAYDDARLDPAILHYSGHIKPWHYYAEHPMKGEYFTYLEFTPWKGFKGFGSPTLWQKIFGKAKYELRKASDKFVNIWNHV